MKKTLAFFLAMVLLFGFTACAETIPEESKATEVETAPQPTTEETKPITYTYKTEPMQNAKCVYYGPNAYIPNVLLEPSKVQGKIVAWTQCPNCWEESVGSYFIIDPAELDFSSGDTIMHSDVDSCWDCHWDKDIDQFMWTIRIIRIPE